MNNRWLVLILVVFLIVGVSANQAIGEEEEKPTEKPTAEPTKPTPTPTVTPSTDPHADFTSNVTVACYYGTSVPIQFTSTSTGTAPLNYDWDIDGDYYDVATFERLFDVGVYTVSLNVSNGLGYDEEIKTNYITILNCTSGGGTTIITTGGSGGGQVIYPANLMGSPGLMVLLSLGFVGVGCIVVMAFAINGRRRDM